MTSSSAVRLPMPTSPMLVAEPAYDKKDDQEAEVGVLAHQLLSTSLNIILISTLS